MLLGERVVFDQAVTPIILQQQRGAFRPISQSHTPSIASAGIVGFISVETPPLSEHLDLLGRWFRAWADRAEADELEVRTTTLNILRGEEPKRLDLNPPSAWQAAQQLRSWLGVTFEQLSAMTGIGVSTFHSWSDADVVPRPSKVSGLWHLYTFARALHARLGAIEAPAWLRSGHPSPLRMMLEGRVAEVEEAAYESALRPISLDANPFMAARLEDGLGADYPVSVSPRAPGTASRAKRPVSKRRPTTRD